MEGQMQVNTVGTAIGNVRVPTLDEARSAFAVKLSDLNNAHLHMTETNDPEVFAFRARAVSNMCYEMLNASSILASAAERAASK